MSSQITRKTVAVLAHFFLATVYLAPKAAADEACDFAKNKSGLSPYSCGTLEVPENYNNTNARTIKIRYIVLKAKDQDSAKSPLVFLSGGPGSSALQPAYLQYWRESPLRATRDIILFDQRGIGHSSALPDIGPKLITILAQDLDSGGERQAFSRLIADDRRELTNAGIAIDQYNSFASAKDIGRLMAHLGHDTYNLYGISYGTRLARIVQGSFPDRIRSVFLQSPNPLEGDFLLPRLHNYSRALGRLFDYCKSGMDCGPGSADLKQDYVDALKGLQRQPINLETQAGAFIVNPQDAIYLLRTLLYRKDARVLVPDFIRALGARDSSRITEVVERDIAAQKYYNSSMWLAVERYEKFYAADSPETVKKAYDGFDLLPFELGLFTSLYLEGSAWHGNSLAPSERRLQVSDIPTIILVNQDDPVTPPSDGVKMQQRLPNSRLLITGDAGHGAADRTCQFSIMSQFMDNPEGPLDTTCLNLEEIRLGTSMQRD